jgi:hypothetical protein
VTGVIEAAARRLDVGLRSYGLSTVNVVENGVNTGKAGAGGKEDRQEEKGLHVKRAPSRVGEHAKIIT